MPQKWLIGCCLPNKKTHFHGVIKNFFICQLKRCPTQVINPAKEVEPEKKVSSSSEESSSEEESSSDEKEEEKKEILVPEVPKTSEVSDEKVMRSDFIFLYFIPSKSKLLHLCIISYSRRQPKNNHLSIYLMLPLPGKKNYFLFLSVLVTTLF